MSVNESRRKVIWLGLELKSFDYDEFRNRKLDLVVTKKITKNDLNNVCSIIFFYNSNKPGEFKKNIQKYANDAAQLGIHLYAYSLSNTNNFVNGILEELNLHNIVKQKLSRTTPAYILAEEIARHDFLHPFNENLIIVPKGGLKLKFDEKILLKGAFWGCTEIEIELLSGGLSGRVFLIHATYNTSRRNIPLPFFAKIDKTQKIKHERKNYSDLVFEYIPFYLRPNYLNSRCIDGSIKGIIVGNFVEVSEPLMHVARRGHAHNAINSLLDIGLHKWHLIPSNDNTKSNLAKILNGRIVDKFEIFDPILSGKDNRKNILDARYKRVQNLGVKRSPTEILDVLYSLEPMKFKEATIHGDLHGYNVMVRNNDAILIDFYKAKEFRPIISDFASLEVSLIFHVEEDEKIDHKNNHDNWKRIMDSLYSYSCIIDPSCLLRGSDKREWQWLCVKQIRIRAMVEQDSGYEYAIALIMHLMRRTTFGPNCTKKNYIKINTDRDDYAYILAEKLLNEIIKKLNFKDD